jgi:hypothetical protein
LHLDIHFDADLIDPDGGRDLDVLSAADYSLLVKAALRKLVPEAASRSEKRELNGLVSSGAVFELRDTVMADAQILGQTRSLWLPLNGDVDLWIKARLAGKSGEDMGGKLSANQRTWLERLQADDRIELRFNRTFFTSGDSREPELAGIWGATKGSVLHAACNPAAVRSRWVLLLPSISRSSRAQLLGGYHRGQYQQPCRGTFHRVRPAGSGGVHQLLRPAALCTAGWWPGAEPDDAAGDHHRVTGRDQGSAAFGTRGCARA